METIRERAKDNLPHVLLTLLSIIQALALELLWSKVREADYLFTLTWESAVYWAQAGTSFFGIFAIWLVYATTVMRFRWVPAIDDSVYPFVVGLLQFMLVEAVGPGGVGAWLILLALVFVVMNWVSHVSMRRARADLDNVEFFRHTQPATFRDFIPAFAIVGGLLAAGALVLLVPNVLLALLAVTAAFGLLLGQVIGLRAFWNRSVFGERNL